MTISLRNRVTRLEVITGGRGPSEEELAAAEDLLRRHIRAIDMPEIFGPGFEVDAAEVLLMKTEAAAGKIAAAQELRGRYYEAKGMDIEAEGRRHCEAEMAKLREIFGVQEDGTPNPDKQPWRAKGGDK